MRRLLRIPHLLRADQNGSVTIEFALLMVFLLMVAAAGVDLSNISGLNREIERSTSQIAAAITSCPSPSTPGYGSCTTDFIRNYPLRQANTLIRFSSAQLTIMQINKVAGGIRVCGGNGTYLDSDIMTNAQSLLGEKDVAIVVVISTTYLPFLPVFTKLFIGGTSTNLRGHTIAVQLINMQLC